MENPTAIHERFIFVYDDVIPEPFCREIIQGFEKDPETFQGKTASGISPVKQSRELYIDPAREPWKGVDQRLFQVYGRYAGHYFSHFPWLKIRYSDMGYYIKKYEKESGYFHPHIDASVPKNSSRILVMLLYLNTVEEGGETHFTHLDLKVKPVAGRLLLFPPMWMYPHQALMPLSHHKYTVNTFLVLND